MAALIGLLVGALAGHARVGRVGRDRGRARRILRRRDVRAASASATRHRKPDVAGAPSRRVAGGGDGRRRPCSSAMAKLEARIARAGARAGRRPRAAEAPPELAGRGGHAAATQRPKTRRRCRSSPLANRPSLAAAVAAPEAHVDRRPARRCRRSPRRSGHAPRRRSRSPRRRLRRAPTRCGRGSPAATR